MDALRIIWFSTLDMSTVQFQKQPWYFVCAKLKGKHILKFFAEWINIRKLVLGQFDTGNIYIRSVVLRCQY